MGNGKHGSTLYQIGLVPLLENVKPELEEYEVSFVPDFLYASILFSLMVRRLRTNRSWAYLPKVSFLGSCIRKVCQDL